jgi:hypothetical protein
VGRRLAAGVEGHAPAGQPGDQLGAGERPAAGEDLGDRPQPPLAGLVVQAELPPPAPAGGGEHRPEQGDQPADVLGGEHVEGAAHRPGAHHRALGVAGAVDRRRGEARAARPHRQPRRPGALRLQGADAADHLVHRGRRRAGEALRQQAQQAQLRLGQ